MNNRTLSDADIDALREALFCNKVCSFTPEEVQFVRDWLNLANTAKSEVIKIAIKSFIWFIGIVSGIIVAYKIGLMKGIPK